MRENEVLTEKANGRQDRNGETQAGFSLLEMLLSVGLLGLMSVLTIQLMHVWAKDEQSRSTAEYMNIVYDAASDMVKKYKYFDLVYDEAAANGGALDIPILGDPAALGVPFTVEQGGPPAAADRVPGSLLVSPSFLNANPLGQSLVVVVRVADQPTSNERALDIFLATAAPFKETVIRQAAESIGGNAGIISALPPPDPAGCLAAGCPQTIRGVFGDWMTDLNAFTGSAWAASVIAAPPVSGESAYLAIYRHITEDEAAGDYLYRTPQPDKPELNAMYTDLSLSENSIIGADNVFVGNELNVTGYLVAQGSVNVAGRLRAHEVHVEGDVEMGQLYVARTYDENDTRIDESQASYPTTLVPTSIQALVVEGELAAQNLQANNVTAAQGVGVNSLTNGTIKANLVTTSSFDATGAAGIFGLQGINAAGIDVADRFTTNSLTAENITTSPAGTLQSINTNVTGDMTVQGNLSAQTTQSATMTINRLTQCLDGCVP